MYRNHTALLLYSTVRMCMYNMHHTVICLQYGCGPDKVVAMLHGHSDRANCVRWVSPRSGHAQYMWEHRAAVELVSGSVDKNVIVWKKSDGDMVSQLESSVYVVRRRYDLYSLSLSFSLSLTLSLSLAHIHTLSVYPESSSFQPLELSYLCCCSQLP